MPQHYNSQQYRIRMQGTAEFHSCAVCIREMNRRVSTSALEMSENQKKNKHTQGAVNTTTTTVMVSETLRQGDEKTRTGVRWRRRFNAEV